MIESFMAVATSTVPLGMHVILVVLVGYLSFRIGDAGRRRAEMQRDEAFAMVSRFLDAAQQARHEYMRDMGGRK